MLSVYRDYRPDQSPERRESSADCLQRLESRPVLSSYVISLSSSLGQCSPQAVTGVRLTRLKPEKFGSLDETRKEESPLLYHIRRETWRMQFVTHNHIVLTVFSISSFVNKTVF